MPILPLGGKAPGSVYDGRNPTLIPNFDRPVSSGNGVVGLQSPAAYLAANPRTDATVIATIGGSITNGDTVALTITNGTLPGGSLTVTYPVVTADTTTTVAEGLVDLINSSLVAQNVGLYAEMGGTSEATEIVLHWNGPVGNSAVASKTVTGSATETVTFTPANGDFSSGTGAVIAANNFTFGYNGVVSSYFYGEPYPLGADLIALMVTQGMPIV